MTRSRFLILLLSAVALAKDPLPSWNNGPAKQRIVDFVKRVTKRGSPDFVAPADRIAVFDNDGTLWAEQPMYFQFLYAAERIRARAAKDPAFAQQPAVVKATTGNPGGIGRLDVPQLAELFIQSSIGMTDDDFVADAKAWLDTAKHTRYNRLYRELIYQPQLELLSYLRSKDFRTYICSGGGIEFVRALAPVYDIPPEQVIGTVGKFTFSDDGKGGVLRRTPELLFLNDRANKPIGIHIALGRRPVLAFGNSDGDLEMLQYTDKKGRPALSLIVHHDDAGREYAYDRQSRVGRLDKALDEAATRNWVVVSMKNDWKRVFPFEK